MKRHITIILALAIAASLVGCTTDTAAQSSSNVSVSTQEDSSSSSSQSTQEESSTQNSSEAVTITFTDNEASTDADNVKTDGTAVTISESGTYILTGSCSDGSVKVKKGTTGVTLILSDLNLSNSTTAPIVIGKSSEVTIEAAEGTSNTLSDTEQNNDTEYTDNQDAENAVIKCKDGSSVTLCGSGTLTINANGKNGIKSGATDTETSKEASLTIKELTLNITASVNDAVNAENLLNIESGTLTIDAADDGLHCDLTMNVGADDTDGPTITITNAYEGIEAASLNILSGNIDITCTDDCLNAANGDLTNYSFEMNISGGTIKAYTTTGDGFDSNGSMTISGGNIEVWTANTADNQPLDAEETINITGGTVLAAGGSNGMGISIKSENAFVTFGNTEGMGGNMGGGPQGGDQPEQGGNPPQMNSEESDNSQPSGTPAPMENGSDNSMPEGTPPTDGEAPEAPTGNAPQGENGTNNNQPQMPNGDSSQKESSLGVNADNEFTITDSDGNVVYTGKALCNASYVFYSSADLNTDSTYTLTADETSTESTAQTELTGNQMGGQPFGGDMGSNGNGREPNFETGTEASSSEASEDSEKNESSNS